MQIYLDSENSELVFINKTKDSDRLMDLKEDEFTLIMTIRLGFKGGRGDIDINYDAFNIPEENRKLLTATEYINKYNLTF